MKNIQKKQFFFFEIITFIIKPFFEKRYLLLAILNVLIIIASLIYIYVKKFEIST